MSIEFVKEIMLTQVSTASVSFVASSAIAAFIAFGQDSSSTNSNSRITRDVPTGFHSPYRRLIFGLSISDACQSIAIIAGPWLIRSDVPQALWGIGNAYTCQLDGFLFLVGMATVPMYTLCLCIYYVCKIKGKMTDAQFADRIEKKMHVVIITLSMGLYTTALVTGAINPGTAGNICTAAAYPTGCRQHPEMFGECNPLSAKTSLIFGVINTIVIPFLCLTGIIGCLAMLFWHVIMMDRIFGRSSRHNLSARSNAYFGRRQRNNMTSQVQEQQKHDGSNHDISFPPPVIQNLEILSKKDSSAASRGAQEKGGQQVDVEQQDHMEPKIHSQADLNSRVNAYTLADEQNDQDSLTPPPHEENHCRPPPPRGQDPEAISRLYKRELVTQAWCYVAVFCTTILTYSTLNTLLLVGIQPSKRLLRATVWLYPLGGLFHIIVHTRPNVAHFLRECPECSRLRAFWLVLKAGGEIPNEYDSTSWNFNWRRVCCFCRLFLRRKEESHHPQREEDVSSIHEHAPIDNACISHQETISELQFGMPSKSVAPDSSLPDSALGINGLSMSFDSSNAAHRHSEDWFHLEGNRSKMVVIQECDSKLESSEIIVSREHTVDDLSSIQSSLSRQPGRNQKEDMEAMWDETFKRVRKWRPSE